MDKKNVLETTGEDDPARVYKVDLSNRNIREMSSLKQFDKLRCLILNYNFIEHIEGLQVLPDLRELHLESNAISKLEGLQGNKALQLLNLKNNRIEKIQNIAHLARLDTLLLDHNSLKRLTGLQYLKELKYISATHNVIDSIDNLPAFSKLINLELSHNRICTISNTLFSSSKTLITLDLSHNGIQNTSFLQSLTSLEILNLSYNHIKELQVTTMPNLEILNLSHNDLQSLPSVNTYFPQLMTLNISHNMICSEHQALITLSEAQYLTQLDFRENPMHSTGFQNALQRIHCFDYLNGQVMTKAGAKYDLESSRIQLQLQGEGEEQLQEQKGRPSSGGRKKKPLEKSTFYEDIDRVYQEFSANDLRIKVIREQYLKICGAYNITNSSHSIPSEHLLTEPRTHSMEIKAREESEAHTSQQLLLSENELNKLNEKNLNKWKELKQREKSFNIRDVIKKNRVRDPSNSRPIPSTNTASNGFKSDKIRSELLRTQALPRKTEQLLKTMVRPTSVRKKQ